MLSLSLVHLQSPNSAITVNQSLGGLLFINTQTPTQRPVWLFSMDSEQFWAAPTTTGGLKAYYKHYGKHWDSCNIELVHLRNSEQANDWQRYWLARGLVIAQTAIAQGQQPVAGFSFYTWNAAEFLELIRFLKQGCPELIILAGGPHVQQAEDYLFDDPIDVIFLGEGEASFQEFLDCKTPEGWANIDGLAYLDTTGNIHTTAPRARIKNLDTIPSALEVVPLTDDQGRVLYDSYSYETSRGCPFTCAFCEWGTGAIGSKMHQLSMKRIGRDWRQIIDAGIKDIWLADSNFGALREDLEKAELICQLKQETGLPSSFATSWSKKHSPRVQEIVMLLNRHGLLPHYQLALQTLTPLALELSNRENMDSNKYKPIAKQMSEQGVPIAAELIWGLPGDNLADYETNLDALLAQFPNINIFGYTLLPGTEFYRRRDEYQIETIPVAGYGKAKGEYVVGCHTFSRDEGIEGYFLINAHIILNHGYVMPLVIRYLAMEGSIPVSPLLRLILRAMITTLEDPLANIDLNNRMEVYENRDQLYLIMLDNLEQCFKVIQTTLLDWLYKHQTSDKLIEEVLCILQLDHAFCPRYGQQQQLELSLSFNARRIKKRLDAMELPCAKDFINPVQHPIQTIKVNIPGGVGDFLKGPDGGSWVRGELIETDAPALFINATTESPDVIAVD